MSLEEETEEQRDLLGNKGNKEEDGEEESEEESEEETEALEPLETYFKHTEFEEVIKIQSRCYIKEAMGKITQVLNKNEIKWFHSHPQFKHFFHMHLEKKNKLMGMWMLLLHTAKTTNKQEAWFIINGVPIRYSLKEHGLISGLYCHNYPLGWKNKGGLDFVERHFEFGSTISHEAIKHKFFGMKPCRDRLNMVVLYFLSSIIIGKAKKGEKKTFKGAPSVDPFFLRAANDLRLCETFPWGRFSFDDNMAQMKHLFENFSGVVEKEGWCYPSFHIPLQLLAFETIRVLQLKYREQVEIEGSSCPRMCTIKFTKHAMTGFPLYEIYETLGTSKEIDSIFIPTPSECALARNIFDDEEDIRDEDDYIVQSWEKRLLVNRKPIFLEVSFEIDVNGPKYESKVKSKVPKGNAGPKMVSCEEVEKLRKNMLDIQEGMSNLATRMEDGFEKIMNTMIRHGTRLEELKEIVKVIAGHGLGRYGNDGDCSGGGDGCGLGNQNGDDVNEGGEKNGDDTDGGKKDGEDAIDGGKKDGDASDGGKKDGDDATDGGKKDGDGGEGGKKNGDDATDGGKKDGDDATNSGKKDGNGGEGGKKNGDDATDGGKKETNEIAGEKRKKKPSVKRKSPYTTMKGQKRRKK